MPETQTPRESRRTIGAALSFGTNFLGGMLVFALGGQYLDKRSEAGGAFWTLIGIFLGLGYGGYELWKLVRQLAALERQEQAERDLKRPKDGPR